MTYINSLGITRMCEQETISVYRSSAGALPTEIASCISTSHVMPFYEINLSTEVEYENFKTFEIKQLFTLYSGILPGDEVHVDSNIYDVRVVNKWQTPDYYHLVVEETK